MGRLIRFLLMRYWQICYIFRQSFISLSRLLGAVSAAISFSLRRYFRCDFKDDRLIILTTII